MWIGLEVVSEVFLRVVCQCCGKVDTIDTNDPDGGWVYFLLSEFVSGAAYWESQYDVWLCHGCEQKLWDESGLASDERRKLIKFFESGVLDSER